VHLEVRQATLSKHKNSEASHWTTNEVARDMRAALGMASSSSSSSSPLSSPPSKSVSYDISYVLGGKEKCVESVFVSRSLVGDALESHVICCPGEHPKSHQTTQQQQQQQQRRRWKSRRYSDGTLLYLPPSLKMNLQAEGFDVTGTLCLDTIPNHSFQGKKDNIKKRHTIDGSICCPSRKKLPLVDSSHNVDQNKDNHPMSLRTIQSKLTSMKDAATLGSTHLEHHLNQSFRSADEYYLHRFHSATEANEIHLIHSKLNDSQLQKLKMLARLARSENGSKCFVFIVTAALVKYLYLDSLGYHCNNV
jgi:hypothetical protein